ncbi:beta-ketoacyl-ACP reductase [Scytonema hofmannii PCC 7110]|uniref:Beta-ketoacyl-ACP reductase n=1 Tax=Scytonema hofmannii PCC 7110 TaxID=128403 RepID=A0A139XGV2_9CYAN|nr:ketoacyl-ACP synthase III [Scytonema hofmannii]KYC43924.1 beta-ketoacyl-ACP reductase [Scytonema hofmannii PCC 7110]
MQLLVDSLSKSLNTRSFLERMQVYKTPVSQIKSLGVYLPEHIVDNEELAAMIEGPSALKNNLPKLIERLTGIKTRHYAKEGTSPSELAVQAAWRALETANLSINDIDTLIFAATDTDIIEPATANIVQAKMGISRINAFDVKNACNSVLQALNIANSLIANGAARRVLIVSGEVGSYTVNRKISSKEELRTKIGGLTLGDGGAAIVVEPSDGKLGFLELNLMSMGEYWHLCHIPEDPNWRHSSEGMLFYKFYLDLPELAKLINKYTVPYFQEYNHYRQQEFQEGPFYDHLALVVGHQISKRFIEDVRQALNIPPYKSMITVEYFGNTASTAIPLALHNAIDSGLLNWGTGQEVMLFGAASGYGIGHLRVRI